VERLLLVVALVAVAVAVAFVLQRRRPQPAPTNVGYTLPAHVDRADFDRPDAPWLVAVFTSAACSSCAGVWDKARLLASDDVATQQLEVTATRPLHQRYGVNAVPSVVVADAGGVVRATFVGPVTATDLWASVAELREPGSLPPDGCDHGAG
jgi:Thioredoxin